VRQFFCKGIANIGDILVEDWFTGVWQWSNTCYSKSF